MSDQFLKLAMSGIQKYFIPFMSNKYKEFKLKQLRKTPKKITCILLPRKCGKTYLSNYINTLEVDNLLAIDFDSSTIIKNSYEYEVSMKLINDNYNVLMLPSKIKIVEKLKEDFDKYAIVILTSDHNLCKYLEDKCELLIYLPSSMYYNEIYNMSNETDKLELFKSYNSILKLSKNNYKTYSSMEELREYVKMLF